MRHKRVHLYLVWILGSAGCSKGGAPSFGVLDPGAVPQITFDGKTEKAITRGTAAETSVVQGECDPRVRAIAVRVVDQSTTGKLDVISVGAPTVTCASDGRFTFTLKTLTDLVGVPKVNATYRIEFRSETSGGTSNPSLLLVTHTRDIWERWRLTSGGTESGAGPRLSLSTSFRADVRVTNRAPAGDPAAGDARTTAQSPSFRLKLGRASR